jgi:hypothetical protein
MSLLQGKTATIENRQAAVPIHGTVFNQPLQTSCKVVGSQRIGACKMSEWARRLVVQLDEASEQAFAAGAVLAGIAATLLLALALL